MRTISDTIARLAALRGGAGARHSSLDPGRLSELPPFGTNPGDLRAWTYVPGSLGDNAPLVVVLHGCTQTAASYNTGSGWSEMADRYGFALLFPEQQRRNNPNLCFNWFSPEDSRRGCGEALSIRQMIAAAVDAYRIHPERGFVTGLSAGGAMASMMLATYPELFGGGAIIAGLPFGCARTVPEAFDRMRGHGLPGEVELAALVRRASDHTGRWPIISVWHGSGDATVNSINAGAIVTQWRVLHGLTAAPTRTETVDGYPRRVWCDEAGRQVIEDYSITGLGHGTPLDTMGRDGCGEEGAHMLEANISSTRHLCRFWGLIDAAPSVTAPAVDSPASRGLIPTLGRIEANDAPRLLAKPNEAGAAATDVGRVIGNALRAVGLMR